MGISKTQVAVETPYDNTVSGLTAEDVQAAIDEISGATSPTGTPNTLAYFNGAGNLDDLTNWDINTYAGLDSVQAPVLTDGGLTQARIFNQRTIQVSQTNNQTTDVVYCFLDQVDLGGTLDYNGYTHEETSVIQSGQHDITADVVLNFRRLHLGVGGASTSVNSRVIKGQTRLSGGHVANRLTGIEAEILMDGATVTNEAIGYSTSLYVGGTAEYAYGINQTVQTAGDVNQTQYGFSQSLLTDSGATTENVTAINSSQNGNIVQNYNGLAVSTTNGTIGGTATHVNINSTSATTGNEYALNYYKGAASGNSNFGINLNYDAFAVTGGNIGVNINDQSAATGTCYGLNYTRNGTSGTGATVINTNFNSASAVTGDLRHINLYAECTVSQNGGFLNGFQNGDVTGNWTGIAQTIGADVGAGLNFHNDVINNGAVITGSVFGHSVSIGNTETVTDRIYGFNLNNQAPAEGVEGFVVTNSADLTDNFRGLFVQDTGDSRTKTAIDITLSGAVTDDAQGIRVNVSGLTMASQRAVSGSFEGGQFGAQGAMSPFSSLGVDVGNNITMTSTVPAGTPLTGTDQLIQLFQSNLIADDDISTGPFGLNTNMIAMPSQVAVASGKTVPLLRSLLLGTSVPSGSGGTITEHVVLELLGLPSFGGSVTCPTKIGIQDSTLLGQNFSDGATDAWFIKNNDPATENHMWVLAMGTATKKVTNSSVALEFGGTTRVPRHANLTTAERDALTPLAGMEIFNTDTLVLEFYDGTAWV